MIGILKNLNSLMNHQVMIFPDPGQNTQRNCQEIGNNCANEALLHSCSNDFLIHDESLCVFL